MKKIFLVFFALPWLLIFTGCGDRSVAVVNDAEFFNRSITGEITVHAYDNMLYQNYLEEMARAFEAAYPGTKVNIETFSAMPEIRTTQPVETEDGGSFVASVMIPSDTPQGRLDYISRVNTQIMSGRGADIYAIDVIPLHRFIKSGALENLDNYMNLDPDFKKSEYRQNVIEALRYRDGIWFMPTGYYFSYYAYDPTLIPERMASGFGINQLYRLEDIVNIAIPLYDGNNRMFYSDMFNVLLSENYRSFVNYETERANFLDGNFTTLLNKYKNYLDRGYIRSLEQMATDDIVRMLMEFRSEKIFFRLYGITSLFYTFLGFMENEKIAGIQSNEDGSVMFEYDRGFGINSQSRNKETAWAFIKFLLSKEMQLSMNVYNLPINNEARLEKAMQTEFILGNPYNMLSAQERQDLDDYIAAIESISDMINSYDIRDSSLNDMITQEIEYFFSGARTADEVARILQNKADLYLSE